MKLVIQIPAYNEADTLVTVLKELPKTIPGVDTIETLLVDDGSGDDTIEVAQKYGIDHIVTHTGNRGL